jgi:RNA polymerase sigma-B factor
MAPSLGVWRAALLLRGRKQVIEPIDVKSRVEATEHHSGADGGIGMLHVRYALTRERWLRDELLGHYDAFAVGLARRFSSRREDREDLVQVARMGLIHAIDRFDPNRERPFVAYAQVTILGELKRHIRDHTWRFRVPRALQEQYLVVMRTVDDLTQETGRSPRISEVAARAGLSEEQVLGAMEVMHSATPLSLDQPVGGDDGSTLDPASDDGGFRRVDDQRTITTVLNRLPERDREIVRLRFEEELTQSEIAVRLGVSQMCISRVLSRTLRRMHAHLAEGPVADAPPRGT